MSRRRWESDAARLFVANVGVTWRWEEEGESWGEEEPRRRRGGGAPQNQYMRANYIGKIRKKILEMLPI